MNASITWHEMLKPSDPRQNIRVISEGKSVCLSVIPGDNLSSHFMAI